MAMARNVTVPDSLLVEIERVAHAENKSADEVVTAAILRYLEERNWQNFVATNERRARSRGISEDDVERLISEVRGENKQNGR
jgi:metal-responsive CopG/Arc/MetJ family transcriptional regulator